MIWPFSKKETKANPVATALLIDNVSGHSPKDRPEAMIAEGFQKNVIVYRCVKEITTAVSNLEIELYDTNGDEIEEHPILALLKNPNPLEAGDAFLSAIFTYYLCTGEMAFSGVKAGNKLKELWHHAPYNIKVYPGASGMPAKYVYEQGGQKVEFPVDQITGACDLFFFKAFNPRDPWRGQSPLLAAALSADTHNAGLTWNYSLLKNGARPSGIVRLLGMPGAETIGRIKELFKRTIQGSRNAGEIPMLVDGAEWQAIDQNAKDMDFISTMKETAKYIASALGVPLPLVDNDASTFNNLEQAKERLYTDTVIPLFNAFLAQLNVWLAPQLNGAQLKLNMDDIPALERLRRIKFDRTTSAVDRGLISIDEGRYAIGYEERGGIADSLMVPAGRIPIELVGMTDLTPDEVATAQQLKRANFTEVEIREMILADRAHAHCQHK